MTANAVQAGAVSRALTDWHAIEWQKVNEEVRRLQARIVKATQEGRWNKVKALQHLLTHSFSGKALAVESHDIANKKVSRHREQFRSD